MDFSFTDEQKMIRDSVREFVERELFPLEKEFLLNGRLDPEKRKTLDKKARDQGFWALNVPEEYGGAGLPELTMCIIGEQLYRSPLMYKFGGEVEPCLYLCNEQQKEKYFYPIIRGEKKSCYAFTEPNTGSDFAAITTRAVKKGDKFVINGAKTFITHANRADFIILFVTTDPGKGAKGISCFLVDKDTPGVTLSEPIKTMGDDYEPYTIFFDNCEVPEENLLGELNNAFKVADYQLTHGRIAISSWMLGIGQRCLEMATQYSKERSTFGKPLSERQAIQWMLADSQVELMSARMMVYQAAWLYDRKEPSRTEAFVAKLSSTEMAQNVSDRALQIYGGLGYTREVPIQSFYRLARLFRIGHGTSEIHRMMIARALLKG